MHLGHYVVAAVVLRELGRAYGVGGAAWVSQSASATLPYTRAVARIRVHPQVDVGAQVLQLGGSLFRSVQLLLQLSPLAQDRARGPERYGGRRDDDDDRGAYGLVVGHGREIQRSVADEPGEPLERSTFVSLGAWATQATERGILTYQNLTLLHFLRPRRDNLFFFFSGVRQIMRDGAFFGAELQASTDPGAHEEESEPALTFGYLF